MNDIRVVATNRRALYDYIIEERYEVGMVLTGTEIKSVRAGHISLQQGYAYIQGGELWLVDVHIAPYEQAGLWSHNPKRKRKLLMHRREIDRLQSSIQERGYTLVPLRVYIKARLAKVELGLAKGKRKYDKRAAISKRDEDRRMRREWKEYER